MDGLIFVVGLLLHFGDAVLDEAALERNGGIAVFADSLEARFETVEFLLVAGVAELCIETVLQVLLDGNDQFLFVLIVPTSVTVFSILSHCRKISGIDRKSTRLNSSHLGIS